MEKKGEQSDIQRRVLTMEYICDKFPREDWTHVFTDGSATEATKDGGAGIFIGYKDCNEELAIPTGKYSTNFKAETEALCEAATAVSQNPARTTGQVVLFTDALSVLQALKSPNNKELNPLCTALATLSAKVQQVVLQWVPAHCGIRGNERADILAKEGAQREQTDSHVSFDEAKTVIKTHQWKKWKLQHPRYNPSDSYHLLRRGDQVKIFRLRTGHNRLRHHLYSKFGIGQSDECPCAQGPMTAEHILQSCPSYTAVRSNVWPSPTALETKLYGTLEDLQRTANFIRDTGLII